MLSLLSTLEEGSDDEEDEDDVSRHVVRFDFRFQQSPAQKQRNLWVSLAKDNVIQALKLAVNMGTEYKRCSYDDKGFGCSIISSKCSIILEWKLLKEVVKLLVQLVVEDIQELAAKFVEEFVLNEGFRTVGDILKSRYVGIHGKGCIAVEPRYVSEMVLNHASYDDSCLKKSEDFLHEVTLTAMVAESLPMELEVFVQAQQSKAYPKSGRACAVQISLYEGQLDELMLDENSSKETKGFEKNPDVGSIQKSKAASKNAFGVDEQLPVFLSSLSKVIQGALEMKNMDSVLHYLQETRMGSKKVDEDMQKRSFFEHDHASSSDLFKGEGTGFMDDIVCKNERENPQGLADIVREVIAFDPVTKAAWVPRNKVACFRSCCLGEKGTSHVYQAAACLHPFKATFHVHEKTAGLHTYMVRDFVNAQEREVCLFPILAHDYDRLGINSWRKACKFESMKDHAVLVQHSDCKSLCIAYPPDYKVALFSRRGKGDPPSGLAADFMEKVEALTSPKNTAMISKGPMVPVIVPRTVLHGNEQLSRLLAISKRGSMCSLISQISPFWKLFFKKAEGVFPLFLKKC